MQFIIDGVVHLNVRKTSEEVVISAYIEGGVEQTILALSADGVRFTKQLGKKICDAFGIGLEERIKVREEK